MNTFMTFFLYNNNEAVPIVLIHLPAPYLLNRCLCLFRVSLKNYAALRADYTVRHCRSDQSPTTCIKQLSIDSYPQTHTLVHPTMFQRIV